MWEALAFGEIPTHPYENKQYRIVVAHAQYYDTIRQGVDLLVTTNVGPRDPTLLLVWCGVCGTATTLSPTLTGPIGHPTRGAH